MFFFTGGFQLNICTIVTTTLVNQGNYNIYVGKIDANGSLQWAKRFGGSGNDQSSYIAINSVGEIIITGLFTSSIITFDGISLNGGGTIGFLVKLDSSGTATWARRFGRLDTPSPTKVVTDNADNIYLTGYFASSNLVFTSTDSLMNDGLFLAKYNNIGNFLYGADALGGSRGTGVTISKNNSSNPIICGYFGSDSLTFNSITLLNDSATGFDVFVAALDQAVFMDEYAISSDNNVIIYPNPARDRICVSIQDNKSYSFILYDLIGNAILSSTHYSKSQCLDISGYSKGLYIIMIKSGDMAYAKKIMFY